MFLDSQSTQMLYPHYPVIHFQALIWMNPLLSKLSIHKAWFEIESQYCHTNNLLIFVLLIDFLYCIRHSIYFIVTFQFIRVKTKEMSSI